MTTLTGRVERITYYNEENGFTIAKISVAGHLDLVTVTGNLMDPSPGTVLELKGDWTNHPRFGEQFKTKQYAIKVPTTEQGIRRFLGSGLIKGIGPVMADRIVDRFGDQALEIIEKQPNRLLEVEGIGKSRKSMILQEWESQRAVREIMLFLHGQGITAAYAAKIYKQYGRKSIDVLRKNPYRLAAEIFGIGFKKADDIAYSLGFEKDTPLRVRAGILHALAQLVGEGHVCYPRDTLVEYAGELLEVDGGLVEAEIRNLANGSQLVLETNSDGDFAYLPDYHMYETDVGQRLRKLTYSDTPTNFPNHSELEKAILRLSGLKLSIKPAPEQLTAVMSAFEHKLLVITGGPGTGKTTIIRCIVEIAKERKLSVLLAAPTGRAAKRMSETTLCKAKTIHRLLEVNGKTGGFRFNERNMLDGDVIVIDEASMIDIVLMSHLLKAMPPSASFVLVGDSNQLPSVGPGNVLKDIIDSELAPVIRLHEIFRQAKQSRIVINAHKIISGDMPELNASDDHGDFYFIQQKEPENVLNTIKELVQVRIPRKFGFDSKKDIQVISPMHRGIIGTVNLNKELQQLLNPDGKSIRRGEKVYAEGDKVMQVRNNYDKDVFNGDIGIISDIKPVDQIVRIDFDGKLVSYNINELDEITHAFAISVHKSQGSEYSAVVMPVLTQHYVMLKRNLIYTAVTRARNLLVFVGTKQAMAIGVKNDDLRKRFTGLRRRLSS